LGLDPSPLPQCAPAMLSKQFFFEKKNQKTFIRFGFGFSGWARPRLVKVFWFFFSKKNYFPSYRCGQ
jgi:hypothetical protein